MPSPSGKKIGAIIFFASLLAVTVLTMLFVPPWEHGIVISLKAEPVFHFGHMVITNTILASTVVVLGFIGFAFFVRRKKHDLGSRFYNAVEMAVEGLLGLVQGTVGRKVGRQIFFIIATFLLFILANNWFGVTPIIGSIGIWEHSEQRSVISDQQETSSVPSGVNREKDQRPDEWKRRAESFTTDSVKLDHSGEFASGEVGGLDPIINHQSSIENEKIFVPLLRSANSDLNMTLAIALISVAVIQMVAIRNVGAKGYLKTFFNFSSPIMFGVGLLEIISECIKIVSFSFRLFGNIFAGDVLLIVIASLVPFLGPIPFIGIELFAGLVQAVVFAMLSMVFLQSHLSHTEAD